VRPFQQPDHASDGDRSWFRFLNRPQLSGGHGDDAGQGFLLYWSTQIATVTQLSNLSYLPLCWRDTTKHRDWPGFGGPHKMENIMIEHDVKVSPSKAGLKREDQLAWKIAGVAADKVAVTKDVSAMIVNRIIDNASVAIASSNLGA
jgi:hypothetical protein